MWSQGNYSSNIYPYTNGIYAYPVFNHYKYSGSGEFSPLSEYINRQHPIRGQATWTDGGQVTKCGIPWSKNDFMTAAVGEHSPFKCGQSLKVRNLSTIGGREVIVTVVDTVSGYPANKINLHRKAFMTLGADPTIGVINIEIIPSPELEEEKWGKYLLEVTQMAYPGYEVTDYQLVGKRQVSPSKTREIYEYILRSPQDSIKAQAVVVYNPKTDRIVSINVKEIEHFRHYGAPYI
ncbi:DUF3889 domain-containing protein [Schinkia sp. CFF1]